jgi:exodeoxyribonuclease III
VRLATWNVNSLKARLGKLEEWLAYAAPDVVCLQETKLADAAFPAMDIESMGYEWAHHGNGRWNGVAILSKVGIADVVTGFDDGKDDETAETRAVTATCGGVRVTSVYVPNGRSLDSEHFQSKLQWLDRLHDFVDRNNAPTDPVAICGDFNVAPTDDDVWDATAVNGATHVSDDERKRIRRLEEWGLVDAFRKCRPEPKLYSWWDYRQGAFHKGMGMRIDLLMVSQPLADKCNFALVDRNARKGESPSDHAPVFIDLDH